MMVRKFVIIGLGFNEIEVSGLKVVGKTNFSCQKELKFHAHQYKRPRANQYSVT
jgi:hypothetical protein